MCNPTSSPPRREMYELTTELAANERPSFLPKPKAPRIGSTAWLHERENAVAVFNAGYDVDGTALDIGKAEPWTVITPDGEWSHFWTHAEALAHALQEARK